ncbi:MAG: hypothetical protein FJ010_09725 [Chloroflexi bacterium]|nr:hypothetical protein [Chloroflexota bacterium]
MRNLLALFLVCLTQACSPFDYSPPPETPEPMSVIHTPALGWMEGPLHRCALDHPEIALTVEERPAAALDLEAAEVILELGPAPAGPEGHATLLGWEQIVIIANPDIPASQLELPDLQEIYTTLEPGYQAWSYPERDELRVLFDEFVMENKWLSPHTKIAPGPSAMLTAIQGDTQAVGYIPQSWLTGEENIQVIPMDEKTAASLRQPIVALTSQEPDGSTRIFLACLTEGIP